MGRTASGLQAGEQCELIVTEGGGGETRQVTKPTCKQHSSYGRSERCECARYFQDHTHSDSVSAQQGMQHIFRLIHTSSAR